MFIISLKNENKRDKQSLLLSIHLLVIYSFERQFKSDNHEEKIIFSVTLVK